MQRTLNPMGKHPSYNNRPTPALQLMSQFSKFQGQRKDELNQHLNQSIVRYLVSVRYRFYFNCILFTEWTECTANFEFPHSK
jgi:hypothetical protein